MRSRKKRVWTSGSKLESWLVVQGRGKWPHFFPFNFRASCSSGIIIYSNKSQWNIPAIEWNIDVTAEFGHLFTYYLCFCLPFWCRLVLTMSMVPCGFIILRTSNIYQRHLRRALGVIAVSRQKFGRSDAWFLKSAWVFSFFEWCWSSPTDGRVALMTARPLVGFFRITCVWFEQDRLWGSRPCWQVSDARSSSLKLN